MSTNTTRADEAPERIYLSTTCSGYSFTRESVHDIEYARVSPADARLDEIRGRHDYRERQGLEGLSEHLVRAHQEIGYLLALLGKKEMRSDPN